MSLRSRFAIPLLAGALAAAAPPPVKSTASSKLRVAFWPDQGEPVTALTARVNGEDARVVRIQRPDDDLLILLVLDLAGDLSFVDPARKAAIEEIQKLNANTQVGLLRAQDGLRVLEDPGASRETLTSRINELTISGRAGLLDTVSTAAALGDAILAKTRVRVALLYITDSSIYNYREDYTNPVVNSSDSGDMSRRFPEGLVKEKIRQLSAALGPTQTPLFVVHLNYQNDRLNEAYQTGLLELATSTGGAADFCRSLADIPASIGRMFQLISTHQTAEIEIKPGKAKQWDVVLSAEGRMLKFRNRFLSARR